MSKIRNITKEFTGNNHSSTQSVTVIVIQGNNNTGSINMQLDKNCYKICLIEDELKYKIQTNHGSHSNYINPIIAV